MRRTTTWLPLLVLLLLWGCGGRSSEASADQAGQNDGVTERPDQSSGDLDWSTGADRDDGAADRVSAGDTGGDTPDDAEGDWGGPDADLGGDVEPDSVDASGTEGDWGGPDADLGGDVEPDSVDASGTEG
ncbi:MAG: hypothetical protein KC609_17050, partial [Myxococcales bacterium]|nr:hypothetical protein [Myxococcales bacterium]